MTPASLTATAVPLLQESSSSKSVGVETVMNDMRDDIVIIPDYQRDCDQWDEVNKSLFVESIINNLTVQLYSLRLTWVPMALNGPKLWMGSNDSPHYG